MAPKKKVPDGRDDKQNWLSQYGPTDKSGLDNDGIIVIIALQG